MSLRTFQFVMVPKVGEFNSATVPHCADIVVTIHHETQAAAESWIRQMFQGWSADDWTVTCLDVTDAPGRDVEPPEQDDREYCRKCGLDMTYAGSVCDCQAVTR